MREFFIFLDNWCKICAINMDIIKVKALLEVYKKDYIMTQYEKIIHNNLKEIFQHPPESHKIKIKGDFTDNQYMFKAFGQNCRLSTDGIFLDDELQTGPTGIVISLYAMHAVSDDCVIEPLNAFKSFPDTAPYVGAFANYTEQALVPHVDKIFENRQSIYEHMDGADAPKSLGGDFAFYVWPLPKIMLCYIFYLSDDDFPASATCLFSNNASKFLPNDALADTGEYTSKYIISLLEI